MIRARFPVRHAAATACAVAVLGAACGQYSAVHPGRAGTTLVEATVSTGGSDHPGPGEPSPATPGDASSLLAAAAPEEPESLTYVEWADRFLRHIEAPVCPNNLVAVVAWEVQESTGAAWNPLATTLPMRGSTRFNSHGVQNYRSMGQGLEATARTLRQGRTTYRYAPIVRALRVCADPMITAQMINASNWCTGCTRGRYVIGVVEAVADAFRSAR